MPSPLHSNTRAPSSGRLRHERAADGVVAGYIHEISRPARVAVEAASRPARARAAGARLRAGARRRSHATGAFRPLALEAGCPGA